MSPTPPVPDLRAYIRDVPDFPKPGILFKDITPLLAEVSAFRAAIEGLAAPFRGRGIDVIAAPEARGFIFAAPLALELGAAFVPIRKPGKLPYKTISREYDLEYGRDALHVHEGVIASGRRVLLLDDVLATGGTMRACRDLVGLAGGDVVAYAFLVELSFLDGRQGLGEAVVFSMIRY
jgi:adenine phosphoribosyltransferase